ncbi:uncharacterized protein Dwil_GK26829 [Drosophila willistoni]|uniref:MD-2-related lipid-recognition domain-containing protein n=1 Tax=Drosophila willistoni TaxID=7260 RepID=A0A0Q9WWK8_DROWI|nr:uncharacterized protein LOC26528831 [Drosophila willistoni]KRG00149.1 uncharacterized protein Dwil_GK26829 [Drosophila willistoni]
MSNIKVMYREHITNGTFVISEDLDDSYEVYMEAYVDETFSFPNKKRLPLDANKIGICKGTKEFLKKYTYTYLTQGVNTDFPLDGSECPIRKGTYYIKEMNLDVTPFPDEMPLGFVKGILYIVKGDQKLGSIEIFVEIFNSD